MKKNYYLYDVHVHTSDSSRCGRASGSEMAEAYAAKGYSGFIVTDHFLNANTCAPCDESWEKRVEILCAGYDSAKKRGDELGISVFFAWEAGFEGNDFLTYGLDREWLLAHPESAELPIKEYMSLVRSSGGFVVHAHPYRIASYITMIRLCPELVDAVEVMNHHRSARDNSLASFYAESYQLPSTAGSDSHDTQIPDEVLITREEILSVHDYIRLLKEGKLIIPAQVASV